MLGGWLLRSWLNIRSEGIRTASVSGAKLLAVHLPLWRDGTPYTRRRAPPRGTAFQHDGTFCTNGTGGTVGTNGSRSGTGTGTRTRNSLASAHPAVLESPLLPASPHGAPPSGRKPAGNTRSPTAQPHLAQPPVP
jgi:hypothetical protein